MLVPDAKYLLDYDPLPVNQAATLMCSGRHRLWRAQAAGRPSAAAQPLLLIGLGGVGMMGLSFAQAMFKQPIHGRRSQPGRARDRAEERRRGRLRSGRADVAKRILKETEGGFDEIVDFAGNEKSMAFAVATVARGGKIVVSGLMGGISACRWCNGSTSA